MKKYRIEVSPEHHKALSLQAAKAGMRIKDYVAPFLDRIIDPETKDFGRIESEGPKVRESPLPPPKDPKVPKSEDSKVLKPPLPSKDPEVLKSEDPLIPAKRYILSELEAGREPTVQEVAEAVGMESRPLGRIMKEAGIQAQNVHRGGVKARRYTFELREKIEEMLEK